MDINQIDMYTLPKNIIQYMRHQDEIFLQEVIRLMMNSLHDEDFQLEQIWKELAMSRAQFYREFRARQRQSPAAFLLELRLSQAGTLLAQTKLNISEVAFQVGFRNVSHFSRKFSQQFGMTPTAFRAHENKTRYA